MRILFGTSMWLLAGIAVAAPIGPQTNPLPLAGLSDTGRLPSWLTGGRSSHRQVATAGSSPDTPVGGCARDVRFRGYADMRAVEETTALMPVAAPWLNLGHRAAQPAGRRAARAPRCYLMAANPPCAPPALRERLGQNVTTPADTETLAQRSADLLSRELDGDSAVTLALLNSPALQRLFADLRLNEAEIIAASRLPNPRLSLTALRQGGDSGKLTTGGSLEI